MVSSKKYHELKAAGLCTKCGKKVENNSPSTVRCISCYEKFVTSRKNRQKERAENKLCIQCGENPAVVNSKHCNDCRIHNSELRRNLSSNIIAKYNTNYTNCRICNEPIDTLGIICQKCLTSYTFTQADAIKRYESKCKQCHDQKIDNLRIVSSDISQPMKKHGPDLYKIICFSSNSPVEYAVLCHSCYRKNAINYVKQSKEFFNLMNLNKNSAPNSELNQQDIIDI
jgi:hypothetical protein